MSRLHKWNNNFIKQFPHNFTKRAHFNNAVRYSRLIIPQKTSFHIIHNIQIPQFTWLLDSQPIIDVSSFHRYAIGQYVDVSGDVISHLNISHVRADDGGLYTCVALNSMGNVEHAARLNVYGKWNTL